MALNFLLQQNKFLYPKEQTTILRQDGDMLLTQIKDASNQNVIAYEMWYDKKYYENSILADRRNRFVKIDILNTNEDSDTNEKEMIDHWNQLIKIGGSNTMLGKCLPVARPRINIIYAILHGSNIVIIGTGKVTHNLFEHLEKHSSINKENTVTLLEMDPDTPIDTTLLKQRISNIQTLKYLYIYVSNDMISSFGFGRL